MATFAGEYNYDFAFAAVPIQLILLGFWIARNNLPVRSSTSFLVVMLANLIMTVTDITGCEVIAVWDQLPLWVTYAVNMAYFIAFATRSWALFDYTANECQAYKLFGVNMRMVMAIPALVVVALTLVTPWIPTIFTVSPESGYANVSLYHAIYLSTYFYLCASVLSVFVARKQLPRHLTVSMLAYISILVIGILLRPHVMDVLVTSYFSILAVLIIYLSAQNPDLYTDRKTGLFNRLAFDRISTELLRLGTPFNCMAIPIVNYESAKSLYGFEQLGRSLGLAAQWLRTTYESCYPFYWGNGCFVLLRPGKLKGGCESEVDTIHERFSRPWSSKDTQVSLDVSVLILRSDLMPATVNEVRELLQHAFAHGAEENYRGNAFLTATMLDEFSRTKEVVHALGQALAEQRIEVYLQPIYSIPRGTIVGAEALARLTDQKMGFISPAEFVKIAERNGDILELGRQIFEKVCAFIATTHPERLGIERINVNLSPAQCLDGRLATVLSNVASRYAVPMSMFNFEVTESSFDDLSSIGRQLEDLNAFGATLSLDDFGTGVSNFTRLMGLPIHIVKLDVGVVQSYFHGESTLLPDLVRMLHNAGMATVLEGVEDQQMMDGVRLMGSEYVQGYFFSRPLPPDQFIDYLRTWRHTTNV